MPGWRARRALKERLTSTLTFHQASADIALPVDLAAISAAAGAALKGKALGRTPEVFVELRATVAAGSAWCEKVRDEKGRS